jgi:hypothetical protein
MDIVVLVKPCCDTCLTSGLHIFSSPLHTVLFVDVDSCHQDSSPLTQSQTFRIMQQGIAIVVISGRSDEGDAIRVILSMRPMLDICSSNYYERSIYWAHVCSVGFELKLLQAFVVAQSMRGYGMRGSKFALLWRRFNQTQKNAVQWFNILLVHP